jgi:hypothetical protein
MKRAFSLGLVSLMLACGGGGGSVDCTFEACGGDPVGTWTMAQTCTDFDEEALKDPSCPEMTIDNVEFDMTGTITISDDNTYMTNITQNIVFAFTVPASCLTGATSCSQLDAGSRTCTGDPSDSCSCTSMDTDTATGTGTWEVNGNTFSTDGYDQEFCVDGDVLKILDSDDIGDLLFVLTR